MVPTTMLSQSKESTTTSITAGDYAAEMRHCSSIRGSRMTQTHTIACATEKEGSHSIRYPATRLARSGHHHRSRHGPARGRRRHLTSITAVAWLLALRRRCRLSCHRFLGCWIISTSDDRIWRTPLKVVGQTSCTLRGRRWSVMGSQGGQAHRRRSMASHIPRTTGRNAAVVGGLGSSALRRAARAQNFGRCTASTLSRCPCRPALHQAWSLSRHGCQNQLRAPDRR
mmetsp:Transcript_141436/g.368395  ORF Transcript_141436/g.368395 Transcript_141436/m.368395 type:complete len:227 (-) Transcript_141436:497-1177(-)